GKLGAKGDNGFFIGYSADSCAYRDVDELNLNAMVNGNTFFNPFANSSTSDAASSSQQNVDPSNMHTFYQPYPHEFQWTKDHPLEQLFERRRVRVSTEGFIDANHPSHVYKLKKALYGLKQAPRDWYIQLFFDLMKSRFEMSMMGEMTFFLGLQVNQSPCEIKDKLDLDQNGTPIDATKYRSMIGALMYLTSSRPDIVHATCLCARYQAKPTEKHLKEVKRIFCYLRGTVNTGLYYTKNSGFELTGFSDADYVGCKDTFKSTSSGVQFLGEKLVSWSLKKQDCTALSTAEAKYVSLSTCCAQVLWMRTQLTDYGFHFNKIPIYCDSKSAIAISCNP
nr:hypothetical protein [Tanacetum cinerariifolium]